MSRGQTSHRRHNVQHVSVIYFNLRVSSVRSQCTIIFPSSLYLPRAFVTGPRRPVPCGGQLGGSLARTVFFTSQSIFCFGPTVEYVVHSLHNGLSRYYSNFAKGHRVSIHIQFQECDLR